MESKWFVYTKKADFKAISAKYGIDQVTARILRNRGLVTDEDYDYFFNAGIDDLYDASYLPDIEKAASLVYEAALTGRHIRIVGDYDIDGVCSTYILMSGLRMLHANVDYSIPERIKDGYGINMRIVSEAASDKVDLLLTCDNGITAIDELHMASERGITVVVTDHHNVRTDGAGREILPEAAAVVNPKLKSSRYPTTEICGAVVAWKLLGKIFHLAGLSRAEWLKYTEFAALATIGDVMPLTGENRTIVKAGLDVLNGRRGNSENVGLNALISCLKLNDKEIGSYHVGFVIGPCINAAGRLETADSALGLFLEQDREAALLKAEHLRMLNESRKSMTEQGVEAAVSAVEQGLAADKVLVIYLPGLHESLAGIVAGRVRKLYGKPTFIITDAADGLKGSGRSIEAYNMFDALQGVAGLLTRFGGHSQAAGLSLKAENLDELRRRLNEACTLTEDDFAEKIWIDVPMPLGYVTERLINEINSLAPFGNGFEKPVFADRNVRIRNPRVIGRQRNALKLKLADEAGRLFDGIMFGDADGLLNRLYGDTADCAENEGTADDTLKNNKTTGYTAKSAPAADILYYPEINEYGGRRSVQMEIMDFRLH